MRYLRRKQLFKLGYLDDGYKNEGNMTIKQIVEIKSIFCCIDETFKWHRDFVWEQEKYIESYITIGTYGKPDFKVIWIHPKRVTGWHNSHIQGRCML